MAAFASRASSAREDELDRRDDERRREWTKSDEFRSLVASFDGTPIERHSVHILANHGYDLPRALAASDAELLNAKPRVPVNHRIGKGAVRALRSYAAGEGVCRR